VDRRSRGIVATALSLRHPGAPGAAARVAHRELLRLSRRLLTEAELMAKTGSDALAQTQIDIAFRLLALTPMLFRVLNSARPSVNDWLEWRDGELDRALDGRWPGLPTMLEIAAKDLLERISMVRWGDEGSMSGPLPGTGMGVPR